MMRIKFSFNGIIAPWPFDKVVSSHTHSQTLTHKLQALYEITKPIYKILDYTDLLYLLEKCS